VTGYLKLSCTTRSSRLRVCLQASPRFFARSKNSWLLSEPEAARACVDAAAPGRALWPISLEASFGSKRLTISPLVISRAPARLDYDRAPSNWAGEILWIRSDEKNKDERRRSGSGSSVAKSSTKAKLPRNVAQTAARLTGEAEWIAGVNPAMAIRHPRVLPDLRTDRQVVLRQLGLRIQHLNGVLALLEVHQCPHGSPPAP